MRRILLVLLGFGVFAGYGSAIARASWHARHHGGCESRWGGERWGHEQRWGPHGSERFGPRDDVRPAAAPAPAPAPQTVVIPQAAPVAPQVFVIMPGQASPAPQQALAVPALPAVPQPQP